MNALVDNIRNTIKVKEKDVSLDDVEPRKLHGVSKFLQLAFSTGRLSSEDFITIHSKDEIRFNGSETFDRRDGIEPVKNRNYILIN